MTFTIVARSEDRAFTGIAMATSSPAVGNRCAFVAPNGAVAFQAVAEPRLGAFGLRLLTMGYSPEKVVKELVDSDPGRESRQIGIVDEDGRAAAFTGAENLPWCGHHPGDGFVAMGNVLAGARVVEAIAEEYVASRGAAFEDRLVRAIEAGRDAGGQEEGQTSASLLTFGRDSYSRCDLRVDVHDEPVGELRRIYDWYAPLVPYYEERARNHRIGRYKDFLAREGHHRSFGPRPPVTR
jgi:uncharacterized Ntn-hydrolase superfamily protein